MTRTVQGVATTLTRRLWKDVLRIQQVAVPGQAACCTCNQSPLQNVAQALRFSLCHIRACLPGILSRPVLLAEFNGFRAHMHHKRLRKRSASIVMLDMVLIWEERTLL